MVLTAPILVGSLSYMLGLGYPIPMRWLNLGLLALATPVQFGRGIAQDVADNPGKWLFHCHNAYDMEAGSARVIS